MSSPFLGQLLLVGFNFTPMSYAQCAGQLMPISANTALFSLLGTYYGGDGRATFGLPNLQGNVAVGYGQATGLSPYSLGNSGGSANITLTANQLPPHTHAVVGTDLPAELSSPKDNAFAKAEGLSIYNNATPTPALSTMATGALTPFNGGNLPHNNMMPFLALNWVISLNGVYPQRQ